MSSNSCFSERFREEAKKTIPVYLKSKQIYLYTKTQNNC